MRTALTIAGSDSSGGAGIQADLKTFAAFGVYGASAITAVTAQSTKGIEATLALRGRSRHGADRSGRRRSHDRTRPRSACSPTPRSSKRSRPRLPSWICRWSSSIRCWSSSSGERLLDEDGVRALCAELLPRARVVTPNIPEAEALSGRRIQSMDDAREAARRIHDMGAAAVIITGGHGFTSHPAPRTSHLGEVVDLLFDGDTFHELRVPRVESRHTHGTGCTFASAVAAGLALGRELPDAAARAQQYVAGAIAHAPGIGHGRGPLDHFWERSSWTASGPRILNRDAAPGHRPRAARARADRRGRGCRCRRRRGRRGRDVSRPGAQPQPRAQRPISGVRGVRAAGAEGVRADRRRDRASAGRARGWRCTIASAGSRSARRASRSRRARRIAATPTPPAATRSSASSRSRRSGSTSSSTAATSGSKARRPNPGRSAGARRSGADRVRVTVRLFARLRDIAGASELARELAPGATIGDALAAARRRVSGAGRATSDRSRARSTPTTRGWIR